MNRVVERCPSCGVEHDHAADGCEACGTALRYWCRTHSREIGWLDGEVCPRCPPVAARATPERAAAAAPPPPPSPPLATSPAAWRRRRMAAPPPAVPVAEPPPPTPVAVSPAAPLAVEPAEAENRAAKERAPQGPLVRLLNAVLTLLQAAIAGALLGVGAGACYAFYVGADIPRTAVEWGVYGGMLTSLYGLVGAGILLMARSRSGRDP